MGSRFSHVEWWGDAVEGGLLLLRYVKDGGIAVSLNVESLDPACPGDMILHLMNIGTSQRAAWKREILEYLRGPEEGKRWVGYGRWWMAEAVFSSFKRMFGVYVMARRFPNMVREMTLNARLYNLFTSLNQVSCVVYA